jgi:uncharacterized protein with NAD-binding domain and iron-sulfur cluster
MMAPRRIVIVGGGMAALAAAFELTRPGLEGFHQVTICQMGWRLGGKCATGRDEQGRILEHGLHVWFGYYENAFRLLRDVYAEWKPPAGQRITRWQDALESRDFTPVGYDGDFIPLHWPRSPGEPGTGDAELSVWASLGGVLRLLVMFHTALSPNFRAAVAAIRVKVDREAALFWRKSVVAAVAPTAIGQPPPAFALEPEPELVFKTVAAYFAEPDRYPLDRQVDHLRGIAALLKATAAEVTSHEPTLSTLITKKDADTIFSQLVDVAAAFLCGIIFDVILRGIKIVELDQFDFRDWLVLHGARRVSAYQSPAVRALYDTMFQYPEGRLARPDYGAGTAAQVVLRMLGTYKGSAVWVGAAGLGEVVVAPLYQVLRARGVEFRFFHKLSRIELTPDKSAVSRLHFDQQVNLKDPTKEYEPTITCGNLICWPAQPRWNLIQPGTEQGDLESHWCNLPPVASVPLDRGRDFDDVILAIALGAFKPLPGAARYTASQLADISNGPCDELIAASDRFHAMTKSIDLVPSLAVQVWCTRTLEQLGWKFKDEKPAAVSAPEPLGIWADMSQVEKYECWKESDGPASVHYFCNVFECQLYRRPSTDTWVPAEAMKEVYKAAKCWFENHATQSWRAATTREGEFDWDVMFDRSGAKGPDRLSAQVLRPNIDPTGCCVSSAAGSTQFRLKAGQSGFYGLYLAGSWIDVGFNTECVEAAVMSGMQAARAICGSPRTIPGEDFLHSRPAPTFCDLVEGAFVTLFGLT